MPASTGRHAESGANPPVAEFPKREMLTPIPGLKGTPWAPGAFASAADCASLAQRVRFCEAQVAQMQHENVTGLYGDSLGKPGSGADTVEGMILTNIRLIVDSLK